MYGYIYETTCKVNGKKYIGMHKWSGDNIDPNYFGSGVHLKNAIRKYGRHNFECRILEWCDSRETMSEREKFYVSNAKAPISDSYYNICDGGLGGHSEYYHQEMTESMLEALERGRHLPMSPKAKQMLSDRRKGCDVSMETRQKLRDSQVGKICINNGKTNKYIHTEELNSFIEQGWVRGSTPHNRIKPSYQFTKTKDEMGAIKEKIRVTISGRKWVTNGIKSIQVDPNLVESYLQNGYRLGRK